ncbi:hypothetical protein HYALB_00013182 [Hymenoscyphus albidus]|uniref:Thioesterase/thiol ester dehydrase-isomerase n=1 Tax=Hymenoscyphus albidus TaxID=595503 RepID=A0A9N9LW97_9HELO|nr:hypothetical protein HYALB_00013182 [Hymenoscyphus albidus]
MRILRPGLSRPLVRSIRTSCHANPRPPGTRHLRGHLGRLRFRTHIEAASKVGVALDQQTILNLHLRVFDPNFLTIQPLGPRYVADCRARFGKCISFGIPFAPPEPVGDGEPLPKFDARSLIHDLGVHLGRRWRRLVTSDSPYAKTESIRWGDIDGTGHVNNKHYFTWAENARMRWTRELKTAKGEMSKEWQKMWTLKGTGLIVRSTKMDYKFPLTFSDKVIVYSRLRSLPKPTDTSFVLETSIISNRHQRVAARCEEEIVVYDYTKKRQTPFPPQMTEALENFWLEQEKCQRTVRGVLFALELRLMILEKLTWDRDGAVEDFGR